MLRFCTRLLWFQSWEYKDQSTKGVLHSLQTTWTHQSIVSVRVGFVLRSAEIQLLLLNVIEAEYSVETTITRPKHAQYSYVLVPFGTLLLGACAGSVLHLRGGGV
jgi:hypothetical protein